MTQGKFQFPGIQVIKALKYLASSILVHRKTARVFCKKPTQMAVITSVAQYFMIGTGSSKVFLPGVIGYLCVLEHSSYVPSGTTTTKRNNESDKKERRQTRNENDATCVLIPYICYTLPLIHYQSLVSNLPCQYQIYQRTRDRSC